MYSPSYQFSKDSCVKQFFFVFVFVSSSPLSTSRMHFFFYSPTETLYKANHPAAASLSSRITSFLN